MLKPIAQFVPAAAFYHVGDRVRLTDEHKRQLKAAALYRESEDGQAGTVTHIVSAGGRVVQVDFDGARHKGRLLHIVNLERA